MISSSISNLSAFEHMINLRELYLRKNQISDPQQLYFLRNLTQLSVLWLQENPISSLPNYRRIVLKILPQLQTLDDVQVTHEERQEASVMDLMGPLTRSPRLVF